MKNKGLEKEKGLYKTYGITLTEWEEILNYQKGVCAICKTLPGKGILCVDHVHVKGYKKLKPEDKKKYVRGLCCFLCNTAIRVFERTSDGTRNRKLLNGVIEYFNDYELKGEL